MTGKGWCISPARRGSNTGRSNAFCSGLLAKLLIFHRRLHIPSGTSPPLAFYPLFCRLWSCNAERDRYSRHWTCEFNDARVESARDHRAASLCFLLSDVKVQNAFEEYSMGSFKIRDVCIKFLYCSMLSRMPEKVIVRRYGETPVE